MTGASSGFGEAIARAALAAGDTVIATSRTQVGALEETTEDELRHLFELHFFGPAALTRAALPHRIMIVEPGAFRTSLFDPSAAVISSPLPEYAGTVGPTRDFVATGGGTQPGDPAKAAAAIRTAVLSDDPPLRLVLGADAVEGITSRLDDLRTELDTWAEVSRSTALDADPA